MGIHDRQYARPDGTRFGGGGFGGSGGIGGGGFGLGAMRMWSVNTWLIVICVAVFVVDGLLPVGWAPMETRTLTEPPAGVEALRVDRLVEPAGFEAPRPNGPPVQVRPLFLQLEDLDGDPRFAEGPDGTRQPVVLTDEQGRPVQVGERTYQRMQPIERILHYSTMRGFLQLEVWRLVGFQFLHSHDLLAHVVFNMIGLFFFGPLVERHLGSKRYLAFYLLCGIAGALLYTVLNLFGVVAELAGIGGVPGLLFNELSTPLIGASAGVYGVLLAGAFIAPNARVLVFFVIPMKLSTMAYVLVGMSIFTLLVSGHNAGGEAGHLGGAIAGWYFIRHPRHLHDFFDFLGRVDPTSTHYRGRRGEAARGRAVAKASSGKGPDQAEVDRILDKVHAQGLASLTAKERKTLREASDDR